MWTTKSINGFICQIKHYNEPSADFGINGGRISKLWIAKDRKTYANYDRGWDVEPTDPEVIKVYEAPLKQYN